MASKKVHRMQIKYVKHALDCSLTSLSKTGVPVDSDVTKGLYHLGKYGSKNEFLDTFLWSDSFVVLWNKSKLNTPVYVKPDVI